MSEPAMKQESRHQIGCADLPPGMSRAKYFEKLSLLEVGAFASDSPPKRKAVRAWREKSPETARFSLLASTDLTSKKSFPVDELGVQSTENLAEACKILSAEAIVYCTPPDFSPSSSNRDRMKQYFGEIANQEVFGNTARVWQPSGLWEPAAITTMAQECGLLVAVDPLAKDPLEEYTEFVTEQMATKTAYLRILGLGISRRRFEPYQLEILAEMLQELEQSWVVFGHQGKYPDSLAMKRAALANAEFEE